MVHLVRFPLPLSLLRSFRVPILKTLRPNLVWGILGLEMVSNRIYFFQRMTCSDLLLGIEFQALHKSGATPMMRIPSSIVVRALMANSVTKLASASSQVCCSSEVENFWKLRKESIIMSPLMRRTSRGVDCMATIPYSISCSWNLSMSPS